MDCKNVGKLLNDFLEGSLSEGIREKINLHLNSCPHCQKEKELFSKTWQLLDVYSAPKLKEDFTEVLMKKIHLEQAEIVKVTYKAPQFSFRRLAPVFAPLFVLILMFSFFMNKAVFKTRIAVVPKATIPAAASVAIGPSTIPQGTGMQASIASTVSDQEIIQDLDILQNLELIENLNLLSEFDVVESQEASIS